MSAPTETNASTVKQGAALIHGIHTDIVCTDFCDRLLVVITQYRKLGTLVSVNKDCALADRTHEPTYTVQVLLGKDEPEIHLIARNLAELISVKKPILFALALKDTSFSTLTALKQLVHENRCW